eukprot:TRINITY_DN67530_c0_g1_i1.p1 TRINITY_DN67530_c0_g1~~TRINITY_DN67530_c0_g1_i1.p1  ORF type:complete len:205 (+),score=38.00 TRINITY_DN67530_c0_g1_i1:46-615(+)
MVRQVGLCFVLASSAALADSLPDAKALDGATAPASSAALFGLERLAGFGGKDAPATYAAKAAPAQALDLVAAGEDLDMAANLGADVVYADTGAASCSGNTSPIRSTYECIQAAESLWSNTGCGNEIEVWNEVEVVHRPDYPRGCFLLRTDAGSCSLRFNAQGSADSCAGAETCQVACTGLVVSRRETMV